MGAEKGEGAVRSTPSVSTLISRGSHFNETACRKNCRPLRCGLSKLRVHMQGITGAASGLVAPGGQITIYVLF